MGIVKLLLRHDRMFSAYVQALRDCKSFDAGNVLADALPGIENATEEQIDELIAAANDTRRCATVSGSGVTSHLNTARD